MIIDIKTILIIIAVIIAGFSIAYLYFSAEIFVNILKRPLKLISWGMFSIDLGVLLVTIISYEASQGVDLSLFSLPLSMYFYLLYIFGSILVVWGARQFKHSPKVSPPQS